MTLYKPSSRGIGRMEISFVTDTSAVNDQKKVSRHKTERKVVRLSDCLSVTTAKNESSPQGCTAFYLNTTQCTFTFSSSTSQEWISALCLLAFQVIQNSPVTQLSPFHIQVRNIRISFIGSVLARTICLWSLVAKKNRHKNMQQQRGNGCQQFIRYDAIYIW